MWVLLSGLLHPVARSLRLVPRWRRPAGSTKALYCPCMLDAVLGYLTLIFGGWTNFTQGAGGAVLGVVGAYLVAVLTSRREIARDRRRAHEEAARAAARDLIRVLVDLAMHVKQIKQLEWTSAPV